MRKTNSIRITKLGKKRLENLIENPSVAGWHKQLLRGILSRMPKRLSKSDVDMFNDIEKLYR